MTDLNSSLRRVVCTVAILNLAYFGVEFVVALRIQSVSLFADSVDFVEDAAVSLLIFIALRWSAARRARLGMGLAAVLLLPAIGFIWALWGKLAHPVSPPALPLGATAVGALAVNVGCAFLLARYRHRAGSLTKAAFLSARNDVVANLAIIAASVMTRIYPSVIPDIVVGLGIAVMNVDAAKEVWEAAREEQRA